MTTDATDLRGPGRPPVGRMINVRMPEDLVAWLDQLAALGQMTRVEVIRGILETARAEMPSP